MQPIGRKMSMIRAFAAMAGLTAFLAASGCSLFPASASRMLHSSRTDASQSIQHDDHRPGSAGESRERRCSLLLTRARLYLTDGRRSEAEDVLQEILEVSPKHPEAAHLMAVLKTESGDLEAGDTWFRIAIDSGTEDAQVACDYGYFCYLTGRWDDARTHLTRATKDHTAPAQVWTNLGLLEARLGNAESARKCFQKAGCSESEVLNNLAFASVLEHDLPGASAAYQQASAADPENPRVRFGMELVDYAANTDLLRARGGHSTVAEVAQAER